MKLYHFVPEQYAISTLSERKLKISNFATVNDPFELQAVDLSDTTHRQWFRQAKEEIGKAIGLLCFSRTWSNPLLWSHYASRHRGVCLEFSVNASFVEPVEYVHERLPMAGPPDARFLRRLALTKYAHWSYEEEYRALLEMKPPFEADDFQPFSDDMTLTQVIVGPASGFSRADIEKALGDQNDSVESFKARTAFKSFDVVKNKDPKLWV